MNFRIIFSAISIALLFMCTSCCDTSNKMSGDVELKSEADTASYYLGILQAKQLTDFPGGELDIDVVIKGMRDAHEEKENLPEEQMMNMMLQQYFQKQNQLASMEANKETIKEGEDFLADNKTKEGVLTTETGLQYKVLKKGSGLVPTIEDEVKVHYTGKLLDGTVFDSSQGKEPVTFGVTQVIPGWTEVLQLMRVGDKCEVYIPYQLAYGERGAGGAIPPFSTLIFEVELLDIVKREASK